MAKSLIGKKCSLPERHPNWAAIAMTLADQGCEVWGPLVSLARWRAPARLRESKLPGYGRDRRDWVPPG